jgi:hypothetical protein
MKTTWERETRLTAAEPTELLVTGRPGLATASLTRGGDGIAYASRLVHHALSDLAGRETPALELGLTETAPVPFKTRMQFLARLTRMQTGGRADWMLFTHVGIARAQLRVPRHWRRPYGVLLHGI